MSSPFLAADNGTSLMRAMSPTRLGKFFGNLKLGFLTVKRLRASIAAGGSSWKAVMYHPRHTLPVHSRSVSVILSCSRYFPSPYYYVPYLSPLLFHISISGSGRDELDQQTELSARSDYILSLYCLCLRIPPCHSVNSVLIVYLHISPLGSSYCSPPYISPYKP